MFENIGGSGCTKRDGFQHRWRLPATSTEEGRTSNVIGVACTYIANLHVHVLERHTGIHALEQAYVHDKNYAVNITQGTNYAGTTRAKYPTHRPETEGTRLPESLVHLNLLVSPHD